ncbi:MAG: AraC family transcriptional regulator [Saprospiraceae bacterium]
MEIGTQILFFFAGLGVFNGALLAMYFLFVIRPKRWLNILFGLLMLMLCIRIGKSLFHLFTDVDRIYRQIGLSACILIGPLLYSYVRRFLATVMVPRKSDWMHMLIPLIAIVVIGLIWPYETYPAIWDDYVVQGIYAVWIFYMIGTCRLVAPLVKKAVKKEGAVLDHWILLVVVCILLLCIAYNLAYYGFPYVSGPLLFSVVFYVLTGFLFSKKNRTIILQQEAAKYQNQKVSNTKANELLQRLTTIMQRQQPYLNPKIKLAAIAQAIDATPHEVSQVINDRLGVSFNQYINGFRISAACTLLEGSDHLTVEGIGQEVGFTSRSAFYTAFKLVMKQTPGQYKFQKSNKLV